MVHNIRPHLVPNSRMPPPLGLPSFRPAPRLLHTSTLTQLIVHVKMLVKASLTSLMLTALR